MSKKSERATANQEAIDRLREILRPGDRVFGIVRTVSRSGMSRTIDFYAFKGAADGTDRLYLSGYIAEALDYSRTNDGALRVGGCGMDMIFSVVYNLGRVLFPGGFGIACEKGPTSGPLKWAKPNYRPKTPQEAAEMVRAGAVFYGRNHNRSGWDTDGGYALKHEAL